MNSRGRARMAGVMLMLQRYAERGDALPKQPDLVREVGCSVSALGVALNRLQDDGRVLLMQRGRDRIIARIEPA